MKHYLSVPEAAARLGITARAAWQRIYRGHLPYRRWGRRVLIPCEELALFMDGLPGHKAEDVLARMVEQQEAACAEGHRIAHAIPTRPETPHVQER
jgi:excisionase family DNA binding protein